MTTQTDNNVSSKEADLVSSDVDKNLQSKTDNKKVTNNEDINILPVATK